MGEGKFNIQEERRRVVNTLRQVFEEKLGNANSQIKAGLETALKDWHYTTTESLYPGTLCQGVDQTILDRLDARDKAAVIYISNSNVIHKGVFSEITVPMAADLMALRRFYFEFDIQNNPKSRVDYYTRAMTGLTNLSYGTTYYYSCGDAYSAGYSQDVAKARLATLKQKGAKALTFEDVVGGLVGKPSEWSPLLEGKRLDKVKGLPGVGARAISKNYLHGQKI